VSHPIEWWERTDREEVVDATRALVPDGGALVLIGDDYSGRAQAVRLAAEFLAQTCGYTCYGSSQRELAGGIRTALTLLLNSLDPPASPGAFGSAFLQETPYELVDAIVTKLPALTKPALVLHDIDIMEPVIAGSLMVLASLVSKATCPIVLSSRLEVGTRWDKMPGAATVTLRKFTATDIRAATRRSSVLAHRRVSDLNVAVDSIVGDQIDALTAYILLRGLE
jgi:hypothetical protein